MSAIVNYGTLKDAVRDYTHRRDLNDNRMDIFMQAAQMRINQVVRSRYNEQSAVLTPIVDPSGTRYALPTDFLEARALYNANMAVPLLLTPVLEKTARYGSAMAGYGYAYYIRGLSIYAVGNSTEIAGNLTVEYYSAFPPFTNDAQGDALLTRYPMAYFYGIMEQYCLFADEDQDVINRWKGQFENLLNEINSESQEAQYSGAPLRTRIA